jgi:predicted lipid-binding transport protein (Tim44 family)
MMRRHLTWLAMTLTSGVLLAGCGGGGSSTTTSHSSSTPATSTATPAPTSSTPATGAGAASGAAIQRAVAACKRTIQAEPSLSARAKSKLEAICGKAAKGDAAAVRKAAQEVCAEVINGSALPAGPERERAVAACKSAK